MSFDKKRVLVLDGCSRQTLPFIRAFRKLGCEVSVYCQSKLDCAYASRLPQHKILASRYGDSQKDAMEKIADLIQSGHYDLVLPILEGTVTYLSENKELFSKYAYIAASDFDALSVAQDKLSVMMKCAELGVPHARTIPQVRCVEDVLNAEISFPLIIKPRSGYGAAGFRIFPCEADFLAYVEEKKPDLSKMVVQEYIPQKSLPLSANLYIDKSGEVKSSFLYACPRVFPVQGGTGCLDVTMDRKEIHADCARLVQAIGLRGCVGVDLMIDSRDDVAKVIEINPRILAGAKVGFLAGVNQAQQLLEDAFGEEVTPMMDYKTDVRIRMSQIDTLWFILSRDRFRATPSWFSIKNTKDQLFSLDDPLPWFAFLLQGVTKLKQKLHN